MFFFVKLIEPISFLFCFGPELCFNCGLNSEKDAQMCIYDASWDAPFGFCCDIDAETSRELSGLFLVLVHCSFLS